MCGQATAVVGKCRCAGMHLSTRPGHAGSDTKIPTPDLGWLLHFIILSHHTTTTTTTDCPQFLKINITGTKIYRMNNCISHLIEYITRKCAKLFGLLYFMQYMVSHCNFSMLVSFFVLNI